MVLAGVNSSVVFSCVILVVYTGVKSVVFALVFAEESKYFTLSKGMKIAQWDGNHFAESLLSCACVCAIKGDCCIADYDKVSHTCFWTSDCITPMVPHDGGETVTRIGCKGIPWKLFVKLISTSAKTTNLPINTASKACDSGWTLFGNKCYKVVHESVTFINAMNFDQYLPVVEDGPCSSDNKEYSGAANTGGGVSWAGRPMAHSESIPVEIGCRDMGSRLAEPVSNEEIDFIKTFISGEGGEAYWLGGTDCFSAGHWVWVSSGEPVVVTDWHEKNNMDNEPNGLTSENCMTVTGFSPYRWNDLSCGLTAYYVCEKYLD